MDARTRRTIYLMAYDTGENERDFFKDPESIRDAFEKYMPREEAVKATAESMTIRYGAEPQDPAYQVIIKGYTDGVKGSLEQT